ncbi:unnamed protein product [Microthlaspi erraticum]|uniref:Uncharacterized protein n=1 Tax=Microthlaspi erraticum TaxID=1685480 RepID=A0A6D2KXL0_9BRAS|nr:unnamed protein product [Microthlaspi erraticum]
MESKSTSGGPQRRPLARSYRSHPYTTGFCRRILGKEEVKQEVMRLGVSLSLYVAESMFLLCDDIGTMLSFCYKLWKYTLPPSEPVSERLLRVIHYVYSNDIKPKNIVCREDGGGMSVQWELIRTTWKDFAEGIIILHRLDKVVRERYWTFDERLLSSAIVKYKQEVLKKLEEKLTSTKDVSEANGFVRETIKSNISYLWMSLFDEEAEATTEEMRNKIVSDVFQPVLDKSWRSEIPTPPVYYPYILGNGYEAEEMKEKVMGLGVELSLCMVESMFLLCDDTRSMLRFCLKLYRDVIKDMKTGLVVEKMLRAMHYVYRIHIKPKKNGGVVDEIGGKSVQVRELIMTTWESFASGFRDLHKLHTVLLIPGRWNCSREDATLVEVELKKVEEKLSCGKDVSKANGFAREAMESIIGDLWKSLFDEETEVVWTREVMRVEMLSDLYRPLLKGEKDAKQD